MATIAEFEKAFDGRCNIVVRTRSGKQYWLHEDQLPAIRGDGLIYGNPLKIHLRSKRSYYWFEPKNVVIETEVAA